MTLCFILSFLFFFCTVQIEFIYLYSNILFPGGFTISNINLSIHGSNTRFFDNYMKALGLDQVNMLLKLLNNYYIVLICAF